MIEAMIEHPPTRHAYVAFTNQGFLIREVSLTAELLRYNGTKADVRREVVENNLYQLASKASRKTSVNVVLRRLEHPAHVPAFECHLSFEPPPEIQRDHAGNLGIGGVAAFAALLVGGFFVGVVGHVSYHGFMNEKLSSKRELKGR
jgi:hypothetical protein